MKTSKIIIIIIVILIIFRKKAVVTSNIINYSTPVIKPLAISQMEQRLADAELKIIALQQSPIA